MKSGAKKYKRKKLKVKSSEQFSKTLSKENSKEMDELNSLLKTIVPESLAVNFYKIEGFTD